MRTLATIVLFVTLTSATEQSSGIDKIENEVQRFQLSGFLEDGIPLKKIHTRCLDRTLYYCVKGTMICIVALDKYENEMPCKEEDYGTE